MVLSNEALQAIGLTLRLAGLTTLILLVLSTPLAWWLATSGSRWRAPVNALVTLPLVLPPTVIGFYLLLALGPQGWLGQLSASLGLGSLSFTFAGLVIGSIFFSLPFAVQPLQYAFETVGKRPMEVAATLRASPGWCRPNSMVWSKPCNTSRPTGSQAAWWHFPLRCCCS